MDPIDLQEQRSIEAPSSLRISFGSNLAGVTVALSVGPTSSDPLGQKTTARHFEGCEAAINALPELVKDFLDDYHANAEAVRTGRGPQ